MEKSIYKANAALSRYIRSSDLVCICVCVCVCVLQRNRGIELIYNANTALC